MFWKSNYICENYLNLYGFCVKILIEKSKWADWKGTCKQEVRYPVFLNVKYGGKGVRKGLPAPMAL